MTFEERKGSAAQQLNGARAAHAHLIVKLMENSFKATESDYVQLLRLTHGKDQRISAMNDLER